MRLLFASSCALNLLLLTSIVAARVDSVRSLTVETIGSEQPDLSIEGPGPIGLVESGQDLVAALKQTPLTHDAILVLTRAWVEAKHREAYRSEDSSYWQTGFSPPLNDLAMRLSVEDAAREELTALFGPDAATEAAFETLFHPLGDGYEFLSSAAQLALQRHQLERLASASATSRSPGRTPAGCLSPAAHTAAYAQAEPTLPDALTDSERAEYLLRFSALSEQLRQSGAASNEGEFRRLLGALQRLDRDSTPQGQARIRTELRSIMGDAAFDRFWASRDPLARPIEAYLTSQGFTGAKVEAAYSIVNRSQEALLRSLGNPGDQASILAAVSRIRQDEIDALTRLAGGEVARGIVAAKTQAATALSRGPTTGC